MGHDLEFINTSMALGDLVVPPIGSICRLRWMGHEYYKIVSGKSRDFDGQCVVKAAPIDARNCSFGWHPEPYLVSLRLSWIYEIVEVPEHAPLFSEWERICEA